MKSDAIISWKLTTITMLLFTGLISSYLENLAFFIGGVIGCLLIIYILNILGFIEKWNWK